MLCLATGCFEVLVSVSLSYRIIVGLESLISSDSYFAVWFSFTLKLLLFHNVVLNISLPVVVVMLICKENFVA